MVQSGAYVLTKLLVSLTSSLGIWVLAPRVARSEGAWTRKGNRNFCLLLASAGASSAAGAALETLFPSDPPSIGHSVTRLLMLAFISLSSWACTSTAGLFAFPSDTWALDACCSPSTAGDVLGLAYWCLGMCIIFFTPAVSFDLVLEIGIPPGLALLLSSCWIAATNALCRRGALFCAGGLWINILGVVLSSVYGPECDDGSYQSMCPFPESFGPQCVYHVMQVVGYSFCAAGAHQLFAPGNGLPLGTLNDREPLRGVSEVGSGVEDQG